MEDWQQIIVETESRSRSNTKRLDRLEGTTEAIHDLALSVQKIALNTEAIAAEQAEQSERLKKLEAEPAERWNSLTRTIFTPVVSTISGGVVGFLVSFLMKGGM